ncbi:transaldolase family protein [Alkalitalea saponilacus]|uniref:Fructose-6-phosphate aldolase 2 n=1 Tax=Alkalitalea saponilacus TaxID=889453 RepID=A0A1T5G432_9BACT|nr:transaldolase family protein [Alkalitalea saponilacus]ASB47849.1 fructose-6-phosphate aldolase [Alkalitalea saponilacus]SKC03170.1 fructose-6-phosphate aldolase 2 [Alkalitalea saponilacus]
MIFLADSANIEELEKLFDYFPLEGVTTSPASIANEKRPISKLLPDIASLIGDKMLHVHLISNNAERMLDEAVKYREYMGESVNFYATIPVTKEGYRAIPLLKRKGIKVTATAVYTHLQAIAAARAGVNFVAPLISRFDNISSHGIEVIQNIVKSITDYKMPTKVLGTSFKTVDQVHRVTLTGCYAATVSYEILEKLISHPLTDMITKEAILEGKNFYDISF